MSGRRIVFLNTSDLFGGVEKNFILRALGFQKRGYDIVVVAGSPVIRQLAVEAGLRDVRLMKCSNDYNVLFFVRFLRFLRQSHPDVVFLSTKRDFWRGGLPARIAGIKNIVGYWGSDYSIGNTRKINFIFGNVLHNLIVNSYDLAERLLRRGFKISRKNIRIIHNGFDSSVISGGIKELDLRKNFNLSPSAIMLGSAGRLVKLKRFHLALPVVKHLLKTFDIHFFLVGSGPEEEALKTACADAGLQDRVHFLGEIKDLFKTSFYHELDIFLFFSENEGLPNVLIESLFYNTYVFALDAPGIAEVVTPGVSGEIATDVGALAACAERYLASRTGDKPANLRALVVNKFSVAQMIDRTEEVFFPSEAP